MKTEHGDIDFRSYVILQQQKAAINAQQIADERHAQRKARCEQQSECTIEIDEIKF